MEPQSVAFQTFIFGSETRSKKRDDVISHCWSASHGSRHPIWLNALVSGERCHYLCLCWVFRIFFFQLLLSGTRTLPHWKLCSVWSLPQPLPRRKFLLKCLIQNLREDFQHNNFRLVTWQTFKPNYKNWNC